MCLLPFLPQITAALMNHSKVSKDEKENYQLSKEMLQRAVDTVATWHDRAHKAGTALNPSLTRGDVTPRFLKQCPEDLYASNSSHPFSTEPNFLRAANGTHLNFLVSPTNSNNKQVRERMLSAFYLEVKVMQLDICPLIKIEAGQLYIVLKQLSKLIQAVPGLAKFSYWYKMSSKERPKAASIPKSSDDTSKDKEVREAQYALEEQEYTNATKNAFQQFIKALNKPGVCGVPLGSDENRFGLHPAALAALGDLHEVRFRLVLFHHL